MTVSDDLKGEAWSPESDQPLGLLIIDHADLATPIRVVNNTVDIVSNGETFIGYPVDFPLPESPENAPPRTRLKIDNVSREIGQAIRSIASPADVTIQVVRQDDPDTLEMDLPSYRLTNVTYNALTVEGDLVREDLTREPFSAVTYSPAEFPGLVR